MGLVSFIQWSEISILSTAVYTEAAAAMTVHMKADNGRQGTRSERERARDGAEGRQTVRTASLSSQPRPGDIRRFKIGSRSRAVDGRTDGRAGVSHASTVSMCLTVSGGEGGSTMRRSDVRGVSMASGGCQ